MTTKQKPREFYMIRDKRTKDYLPTGRPELWTSEPTGNDLNWHNGDEDDLVWLKVEVICVRIQELPAGRKGHGK